MLLELNEATSDGVTSWGNRYRDKVEGPGWWQPLSLLCKPQASALPPYHVKCHLSIKLSSSGATAQSN